MLQPRDDPSAARRRNSCARVTTSRSPATTDRGSCPPCRPARGSASNRPYASSGSRSCRSRTWHRTQLGQRLRTPPDVAEALLAHAAARHGELHARIHFARIGKCKPACGRRCSCSRPAHRRPLSETGAQYSPTFPMNSSVLKTSFKLVWLDSQVQDRPVAVELGRDGRIDIEFDAQFLRQLLHGLRIAGFCFIRTLASETLTPCAFKPSNPFDRCGVSDPGSLVMASWTSGR